jgi:hypothetical protein
MRCFVTTASLLANVADGARQRTHDEGRACRLRLSGLRARRGDPCCRLLKNYRPGPIVLAFCFFEVSVLCVCLCVCVFVRVCVL